MSDQEAIKLLESLPPNLKQQAINYLKSLKEAINTDLKEGNYFRKAGAMKGFITFMAPDFDAPLKDLEEYM